MLRRSLRRLPPLAREALRREEGVSALEFALVAPVLIFMLIASSDVAPMLIARFKAVNATETVGDVAASYNLLQNADMAALFSAGSDTLAPFNPSTLLLRITSVYSDGAGHSYVYWSCGQGALAPYAAKSAVTTTPNGTSVDSILWRGDAGFGYHGANMTFVMVESQYVFKPVFGVAIPSAVTMTNVSYLLPRNASYVGFPWDGVSTHAPKAPTSTTGTASSTLSNGATCKYST